MISYRTLQTNLIANLMKCGNADAEFLLDIVNDIENKKFTIHGEQEFLFDVKQEGHFFDEVFETIKDNGGNEQEIDTVLYNVFMLLICRLNEIYQLYNSNEDLSYYTITEINSVASSIKLDDSFNDVELPENIKLKLKLLSTTFNEVNI